MPTDLHRSLELTEVSHKPQAIMDEVKRFTWQPDHVQEGYKRDFVTFYQRWLGMRVPKDAKQLKKFNQGLQWAMEALDAFFFAGCLTRPPPYSRYGSRLVDLQVQKNVFGMGEPGYQSYLSIGVPVLLGAASHFGGGLTTIFIDTFQNGSPRTIETILETLVHEMAHAIYFSFACDAPGCKGLAAHSRILGQRGHGRLWMQMAEYMRDTIQTWDYSLANFYNTDDIRQHNRERN